MISRLLTLAICLSTTSAVAQTGLTKVYKHDQFADDIYAAVNEVNGSLLQSEPGFVMGEAFGGLFRPGLQDYPLKMVGIDLLFGGPQMSGFAGETTVQIELYLDAGQGPAPTNPVPDYVISSTEFYNPDTNDFGVPIKPNIGYQFNFDETVDEKVPPLITQGNVLIMVRFMEEGMDLSTEYGTVKCIKADLGILQACGCQPVSMIVDPVNTPQTNVLHIVDPPGTCSGNNKWFFFENINATGGVKGDVILRLRAQTSDAGCVPACDGKTCGDDGCGDVCGTCADGQLCSTAGLCQSACQAQCDGKDCGDDGCGGVCGLCQDAWVCVQGVCTDPGGGCEPACDGKACGDDGCGGVCGLCQDAWVCVQGVCTDPGGGCDPACDGKACGDDGCGGVCGVCSDNETCVGGACTPQCQPLCADRECGDDGCGGLCGACAGGETCTDGACVADGPDCTCDGRACGDDGCGQSCGDCANGESCEAGQCVATADGPITVTSISPREGYNDEQTQVSIVGTGFAAGMQVKLGGTALTAVNVVSDQFVEATVPKAMAASEVAYDLLLVSAEGKVATLPTAFTVKERAGAKTDSAPASGCSQTSGSQGAAAWLVALALLALLASRQTGRLASRKKTM